MLDAIEAPIESPVIEAHGARIPALGLGTWELTGSTARRMTEEALAVGYRHLDTARAYGNEAEVGRALEAAGVDRSEVFLTTKIWPDEYRADDFRAAVRDSLEKLRTDYVDLLLLHWPRFEGTSLGATIEELNRAREDGRARHVGVCNFNTELMERAWEATAHPLAVHQAEYHPYLDRTPVLRDARDRGMAFTAYSPVAHGEVAGDETLAAIGERHGKSAVQVALRWLVQQEAVNVIPRTSDPEHLRANAAIFDFELGEEEMERIAGLARPDGRIISPEGLAPRWD